MMVDIFCVFSFHEERFRERLQSLIEAIGTTIMALFITISSSSFAPFLCDLHPNGHSTVQAYNQIVC